MAPSSPFSPSHARTPTFSLVDDISPPASPARAQIPLHVEEDSDGEGDYVLLARSPISPNTTLRSSISRMSSNWVGEESEVMNAPVTANTSFNENNPFTPKSPRMDDLARKLTLLDLAAKEAEEVAAASPRHTPHPKYSALFPELLLSAPSTARQIPPSLPDLERRPMDWDYTPSPSVRSQSQSRQSRRSHPPTPSPPPALPPLPRILHSRASMLSAAIVPKKKKKKAKKTKGLGKKPAVEHVEDAFPGISVDTYDEAVNSITWLMSHPNTINDILRTPKGKLLYYQALLVEFGVCPDSHPLPSTHNAARAMFKSMVHINIADYIEFRGRGREALQAKMLGSNKALKKDVMSSKKRRVPLGEIKRKGLRLLLANHCWQ